MPFIHEAKPWNPLPTMDDYLLELNARELAKDYTRMVRVGLSYFSDYLATEGIKHPDEIERIHIIRFQTYLNELRKDDGEPYAIQYRQKILAYVKGWFTWLTQTETIDKNPWLNIKIGKITKKPKPLGPDEVLALFEGHKREAFQLSPFEYHQREVILTLLYSWGLRVHELCSINLSHVDMRLDSVTVRNKGGGSKVMPYGDVEKTVINRWIRHRATQASYEEDALLINRNGSRITTQKVWDVVSSLGKKVNVEVNPHRFRDTLGTTMLDHDVPVEVVMQLLGHKSRAQTMAYSRINDPVVQRAHQRVMGDSLHDLLRFDREEKV